MNKRSRRWVALGASIMLAVIVGPGVVWAQSVEDFQQTEAPADAADRLGRSASFARLLRLKLGHPRGQGVLMVWRPK